jgi:WhiB family redox-sensing transcriptional regulator
MNTQTEAPCLSVSPELFFSEAPKRVAEAKALCATCNDRPSCLSLALKAEAGESLANRFGIFGGMTPEERFAL